MANISEQKIINEVQNIWDREGHENMTDPKHLWGVIGKEMSDICFLEEEFHYHKEKTHSLERKARQLKLLAFILMIVWILAGSLLSQV